MAKQEIILEQEKREAREKELEENLKLALVPDWEHPYKIPNNWVWVFWGRYGTFTAGSGFKLEYQNFTEYKIPFFKVGSLKYTDQHGILWERKNTITETIRRQLKATLIPSYSIIFAKIGEAIRLNRRAINDIPCCIDNNLISFKSPMEDYRFIYYWTMTLDLYQIINATTIPAIRKSDLEKIPLSLPPLAEQERIVERIESLFSKLDQARETIENILDTFKERKSAILHKAFNGDLTKNWREERGIDLETWEKMRLEDVCEIKLGGTPDTQNPNFWNGSLQWITPKDMGKLSSPYVNFTERTLTLQAVSVLRIIKPYSVILSTRAPIGYLAINTVEMSTNQGCKSLEPKDLLNYKYLYYYMITKKSYLEHLGTGTTFKELSTSNLKETPITVPPLAEQEEIVRILDSLLEKEDKSQTLIYTLKQIDLMKKTILARAFRGVLDTNNPEEESALGLLKEILAIPTPKKEKIQIKKIVIDTNIKKQLLTTLEEDIYKYLAKNNNQCDIKDLLSLHKNSLLILQSIDILAHKAIITKQDNLIAIKS